jgi:hypothetical protein
MALSTNFDYRVWRTNRRLIALEVFGGMGAAEEGFSRGLVGQVKCAHSDEG